MIVPAEYLRAAKLDEVVAKYRKDGYDILLATPEGFDVVASKGERRIVVQVKAGPQLQASAQDVARLRRLAGALGFDDFRLVVANPPREVEIEIEGLEDALFRYLSHEVPEDLVSLSSHTVVVGVGGLELDSVQVKPDGIHVRGSGLVDVELQYDPGGEMVSSTTDFPFTFDVTMNPDLEICGASDISVDTSSWYE